ncbi:hypothetical protein AB6F54_16625 [Providencia huaxiensis]
MPKQRDEKLVELFNDIIRTHNVDTVICTIIQTWSFSLKIDIPLTKMKS